MSWLLILGAASMSCAGDEGVVTSAAGAAGAGADGAGAASAGASATGGVGAAGGMGANGGEGAAGGDLGWPLSDDLPTACPPQDLEIAGTPWAGWANVQFPSTLTAQVGALTEPIYGQVYQAGQTDPPGAAPGWSVHALVGPLGTTPVATGSGRPADGRCWTSWPATFNVDDGNNDEYAADGTSERRGLFSIYYRFAPAGSASRFGDLDGSDNLLHEEQGARLFVASPEDGAPLVVATLNLRCRLDLWSGRMPLVVSALARIDPDLVSFQEDCEDGAGRPQSDELRVALSALTRRGYELRRTVTHTANGTGDDGQPVSYLEGISVLSAHPVDADGEMLLASAHLPRKAQWVDLSVAGVDLRFYATHFDYGADGADARTASALAIVASLPTGRAALVAGDLNAQPGTPGAAEWVPAFEDAWQLANPSDPGLTFPAAGPTRRIDYVLSGAELSETIVGAKILNENDGAGLYLSDHRGLAVAFALQP